MSFFYKNSRKKFKNCERKTFLDSTILKSGGRNFIKFTWELCNYLRAQ